MLWDFVRKRFGDWVMATIAVTLLLGNVLWVLHSRQCRYYGTSSLLVLLTFIAYLRWRERARFGAILFVTAAWCLFPSRFWHLLARHRGIAA